MMNVKTTLLSMALLTGCILSMSAQSYYDDDIYYDASKDKEIKAAKAEAEAKKRAEEQRLRQQANYNPTIGGEDYAPADSYQYMVSGTSTRDVDEYNRRNRPSLDTDSTGGIYNDEFTYTRRIERFHNNDIIADYNDPDLTEYYYSSQQESPTEINIYLNSPAWAWNSWYWPYRPWHWSFGWYSPWYWSSWDWYWGPTWSYYPSYYWHGGYYPWGPSYYPGWGPGHGHHHAWQPIAPTPSGRRPVGVRNGYTGLDQAGRRPSSASASKSSSSSMNGFGNYRPSSPSRVNNGASRPSGSSQNNYGTTTGRRSNSSSYNNSNNSSRSRESYNNSSRNSSSYSSGSRSAGTRSSSGFGGGFSGGNRGGGGGGGARSGRR